VPKPSWLIRVVLQDDGPAPRASHGTASFTKLQSQKLAPGGRWEGNVAPCISDVCTERSGLSTCGYRRRDVNSRPLVLQSFRQKAERNLMLTFTIEHIHLFATINVFSAFFLYRSLRTRLTEMKLKLAIISERCVPVNNAP
jgi:hypothetical protein